MLYLPNYRIYCRGFLFKNQSTVPGLRILSSFYQVGQLSAVSCAVLRHHQLTVGWCATFTERTVILLQFGRISANYLFSTFYCWRCAVYFVVMSSQRRSKQRPSVISIYTQPSQRRSKQRPSAISIYTQPPYKIQVFRKKHCYYLVWVYVFYWLGTF